MPETKLQDITISASHPTFKDLFHRFLNDLTLMVVIFLFYFFAGKGGLSLAFENQSATAVWPPTGIALAALLLFGYRIWPSIFLGALFVNYTTTGNVITSLGISLGNTLEGLVGAYLINRFANGKFCFDKTENIMKFAFFGGLISTMLSAIIGVMTLLFFGYVSTADFGSVWLTWWVGDSVGNLIFAPLFILWLTKPYKKIMPHRLVEAVLLLVSVGITGIVIFSGVFGNLSIDFLVAPVIIWVAFRFGQRETVTVLFLIAMMALAGTLQGTGPFARGSPAESLLLLQVFMGTISWAALTMSALVAEKREIHGEMLKAHMQCKFYIEQYHLLQKGEKGHLKKSNKK